MEKQNLNVTAAERLSAGELMLPVGEVTESVTVDSEGTPVQTASGERSGVLTPTQMSTLMARGRDFLSLLRVMPGVVPSEDSDAIGTRTAYPNVQGMRVSYPSITIDGVTNNDPGQFPNCADTSEHGRDRRSQSAHDQLPGGVWPHSRSPGASHYQIGHD